MSTRLEAPTIRQFADFLLQNFEPNQPLVLRDPDTGWIMDIFYFEQEKTGVEVTCEYGDTDSKRVKP